jgi:hypothetical protein
VLSISESAGCTMPAGGFRGWAHCPLQAQDARHTALHKTHALSEAFLNSGSADSATTFLRWNNTYVVEQSAKHKSKHQSLNELIFSHPGPPHLVDGPPRHPPRPGRRKISPFRPLDALTKSHSLIRKRPPGLICGEGLRGVAFLTPTLELVLGLDLL